MSSVILLNRMVVNELVQYMAKILIFFKALILAKILAEEAKNCSNALIKSTNETVSSTVLPLY